MKKTMTVMLIVLLAAASVYALGPQETGSTGNSFSGNYAFGGSTTVEPVVRAAAESFEEMYPSVTISYDATGSSAGVKGVLSGTFSLGAASRSLSSSEKDSGAVPYVIARDGVAVIVNKASVPADDISLKDLIRIYSGEVTNWKSLGGPDAEIVVFNRDEASGTRSCFGDATVKTAGKKFTNSAAIVTSNGDMVAKVSSTPYAIGYCGFGYLGRDSGTKSVMVGGVEPEVMNVNNGSYPVMRDLILITRGTVPSGSFEEAFINFILSDEGQDIVAEENFIPLK